MEYIKWSQKSFTSLNSTNHYYLLKLAITEKDGGREKEKYGSVV